MGVEPLTADLRMLCDCTGGCELAWEGPQKRMWVTWPTAPAINYPNLSSGILFELSPPSITVQICRWFPVTAFAPFVTIVLLRTGQSPSTGTGGSWLVQGVDAFVNQYIAQNVFTPDRCEDFKTLATSLDQFIPKLGDNVDIEPVRWWENANDVPH